jgi:polyisoprenoid-binding protein YceI
MRALLIAVSTLFVSFAAYADVPAYKLVKEESSLKFIATMNGAPLEGTFKDFTADIHFDQDKPDQSNITVEVNTGSVAVANDDVQENIKLPEWLSAGAFPKATFTCKKLSRNSQNYSGDGELTLRGKTMPVKIEFQMEHMDDYKAIASGSVTLHRHDFDVGEGQWAKDDVVKNEVKVQFRITAEKK